MEGQVTKKGFFQKPENITGLIIPVVLIGLVVMFFGTLAPFLALALQGGVYGVALAALVGLVLFAIANNEWRIALMAFYTVWMKRLTAIAVEMDPIAITRKHLSNLMDNIEEMSSSIDSVAGENKKLQNKIEKHNQEIQKLKQTAIIAKNKMMQFDPKTTQYIEYAGKAALDSNQVGRLLEFNNKLDMNLQRGLLLEDLLERQYNAAKFVHADMKMKVDLQEDEWKTISAGYNAYQNARKVLAGDEDSESLYIQSMEYMADEMGRKVGEIERFTKNSASMLAGIDIDNEMFTQKGMKMIEEWSSMGDQLLVTSVDIKLPGAVELPKSLREPVVLGKSKYR